MMFQSLAMRKFFLLLFALGLGNFALLPVAQAGMIGTMELVEQQSAAAGEPVADVADTKQTLVDGLVSLGVDTADAYERVDGLTDQELAYASDKLDDLPAGGDALVVLGIVFLVLIVLEIVGVLNVFG